VVEHPRSKTHESHHAEAPKTEVEVDKPAAPIAPAPAAPAAPVIELPGWFANLMSADIDEVLARARVSGHTERTEIQTELAGSGHGASVTVLSDGKRIWSPHEREIQAWFGHLNPNK